MKQPKELRDREGVSEEWHWCEPCEMHGLKNPSVVVRTDAADTPVCEWHDEYDTLWGYEPMHELWPLLKDV